MLHYIVNKFHVGADDSEITAEVKKRIARARKKGHSISSEEEESWLIEAVRIHHANQNLSKF